MLVRTALLVPRNLVACLGLALATDVAGANSLVGAFSEMDLYRRLWMAAIGGFSLAAAFAMLASSCAPADPIGCGV